MSGKTQSLCRHIFRQVMVCKVLAKYFHVLALDSLRSAPPARSSTSNAPNPPTRIARPPTTLCIPPRSILALPPALDSKLFFEPVHLHLQPPDLLVQRSGQLLLAPARRS